MQSVFTAHDSLNTVLNFFFSVLLAKEAGRSSAAKNISYATKTLLD